MEKCVALFHMQQKRKALICRNTNADAGFLMTRLTCLTMSCSEDVEGLYMDYPEIKEAVARESDTERYAK